MGELNVRVEKRDLTEAELVEIAGGGYRGGAMH
jgi:hypothetical protein